MMCLMFAITCFGVVSVAAGQEPNRDAARQLIGTWRVVSYPTSEGDLLKRHGRAPGPLPDAKTPLKEWSYLVFNAKGECALFYPQRVKDKPAHRRITWFHDEDNFASWKLDASTSPWRLDLGSVLTPKFQAVKGIDPKTQKPTSRLEAAIDPKTVEVIARRWTYPAVCRIDGDLLTIVWWQNHRLLENPPEEHRPRMYDGLPAIVIAGLNAKKPLVRDDERVNIPGGVSCLIGQRYSVEPLPIPAAPAPADAVKK